MFGAIPQSAAVVAHQSCCACNLFFDVLKHLLGEIPFVELVLFVVAVNGAIVLGSLLTLLAY